jgi:hypothetical protein
MIGTMSFLIVAERIAPRISSIVSSSPSKYLPSSRRRLSGGFDQLGAVLVGQLLESAGISDSTYTEPYFSLSS